MDYRNFDPDRPTLPPFIRRNLRYLRPVGLILCAAGIIIPFLMVLRLIRSTYFLNYFSFALLFFGPIMFLVGMALDSITDRAK